MEHIKVQFHVEVEGEQIIETAWALVEKREYILDNIPFYACGYGCQDVLEIEKINDDFIVQGRLWESGHSTIHLCFWKMEKVILFPKQEQN